MTNIFSSLSFYSSSRASPLLLLLYESEKLTIAPIPWKLEAPKYHPIQLLPNIEFFFRRDIHCCFHNRDGVSFLKMPIRFQKLRLQVLVQYGLLSLWWVFIRN